MSEFELSNLKNSVSRRNLLFPPSPNNFCNPVTQNSDNPIEYHQTTSRDDNQVNVNENENQSENENEHKSFYNRIIYLYRNRSTNNFARIPLHLLLHILLLSIFEIFLFFNFVVIMEKNAFIKKLNGYFNEDMSYNTFNPYVINALNLEFQSDNFLNYYEYLKNNKDQSITDFNKFNDSLEDKAWVSTILLSSLFVGYILLLFLFYKLSLKKLLVEHFILISLIGCYEYWFFNNIVLPFKIISADELNFIIFTCMMKKISKNINGININSTITNSCDII